MDAEIIIGRHRRYTDTRTQDIRKKTTEFDDMDEKFTTLGSTSQ
jgi:hypothetical protein